MSFHYYQYRAVKNSPPFDPEPGKPCMFICDQKYLVTRAQGDPGSVIVDGFFLTPQGSREYVSLTLSRELCRDYLTLEKQVRQIPTSDE